jgi:hypothetical protein
MCQALNKKGRRVVMLFMRAWETEGLARHEKKFSLILKPCLYISFKKYNEKTKKEEREKRGG